MAYFIGDKEVTELEWQAQRSTTQIGSQLWMNSRYKGPEPSLEVKKALSTADYARDWIGGYADSLVKAGVDVSPAVASIAKSYPEVSPATVNLWTAVPEISPGGALEQRIAEAGGYTGWASQMGVVTAPATTFNNPTSPLAPGSPVSGAGAGTLDVLQAPKGAGLLSALSGGGGTTSTGGTDSGSSLLSNLGIIPLAIIAGVFGILAYLAMKGMGSGRGASA